MVIAAENVTVAPGQTEAEGIAVMLTEAVVPLPDTVILTVLLRIQDPLTDCTVYTVDTVSVATGLDMDAEVKEADGVHA